jgi:hypothetical protein
MAEQHLSLTELGHLFGVSSHVMGRWLKAIGLRTADNQPSDRAFQEGYVTQRPSRNPGTFYWVWNLPKTIDALTKAGHGSSQTTNLRR